MPREAYRSLAGESPVMVTARGAVAKSMCESAGSSTKRTAKKVVAQGLAVVVRDLFLGLLIGTMWSHFVILDLLNVSPPLSPRVMQSKKPKLHPRLSVKRASVAKEGRSDILIQPRSEFFLIRGKFWIR